MSCDRNYRNYFFIEQICWIVFIALMKLCHTGLKFPTSLNLWIKLFYKLKSIPNGWNGGHCEFVERQPFRQSKYHFENIFLVSTFPLLYFRLLISRILLLLTFISSTGSHLAVYFFFLNQRHILIFCFL